MRPRVDTADPRAVEACDMDPPLFPDGAHMGALGTPPPVDAVEPDISSTWFVDEGNGRVHRMQPPRDRAARQGG